MAVLLCAAPAFGQATTVTYQGVLRDSGGNAVPDNAYPMAFSIWNAVTGGTSLWSESQGAVPVSGGAFSVQLGSVSPLGTLFADHSGTQLWLEVSADTGAGVEVYSPRVALSRAPYASQATTADSAPWTGLTGVPAGFADGTDDVDGGDADTVDGQDASDFASSVHTHVKADVTDFAHTHVKADITDFAHTHPGSDITSAVANAAVAASAPWSGLTGVPAGFADDTDDVDGGNAATLGGQAASAFAPTVHTHAAGDITAGTLDIARLPVGNGVGQVAPGVHAHSSLDAPDGSPVNAVAVTNTGNVGIGTPTPNASAVLQVASTTQGFSMPRMSSAQRKAIAAPLSGLQVFDTDLNGFYYWTGSKWDCVSTPAGTVNYFAGGTAPAGYLECNGQGVSTTTFAELFAAIGYTYGGSGGTFNVPDLRGEFVRGWDHGRGLDSGRTLGSVQAQDFKSFSMQNAGGGSFSYSHGPVGFLKTGMNGNLFGGGWSAPAGVISLQWDGSEIRPRNVSMMTCIKY
jgi:phage-related tail fiber protein